MKIINKPNKKYPVICPYCIKKLNHYVQEGYMHYKCPKCGKHIDCCTSFNDVITGIKKHEKPK